MMRPQTACAQGCCSTQAANTPCKPDLMGFDFGAEIAVCTQTCALAVPTPCRRPNFRWPGLQQGCRVAPGACGEVLQVGPQHPSDECICVVTEQQAGCTHACGRLTLITLQALQQRSAGDVTPVRPCCRGSSCAACIPAPAVPPATACMEPIKPTSRCCCHCFCLATASAATLQPRCQPPAASDYSSCPCASLLMRPSKMQDLHSFP